MVVGDNPGGIKGVPVSIGWEHMEEYTVDLDPYEMARQGKRRPMQNLSMGADRRDDILRTLGFSRKERLAGTRVANIVRRQRKDTNSNRHLDAYHEKFEKMKRGLKKTFTVFARGKPQPAKSLVPVMAKSIHTDDTNIDMSHTSMMESSTNIMYGSSVTISFDG